MDKTNNLENIVKNASDKPLKKICNSIFEGKDTITEKFLAVYTLPACIPIYIIAKLAKKYNFSISD